MKRVKKNTEIDELEKLAKNATPGDWEYYGQNYAYAVHPKGIRETIVAGDSDRFTPHFSNYSAKLFPRCGIKRMEDAQYIAFANPQRILKLIKKLRRLQNVNTV
jgi:hypothetical protein